MQLGAADPDARRVKMASELFGKALAADVARHAGACLGLAVNYAGSYWRAGGLAAFALLHAALRDFGFDHG